MDRLCLLSFLVGIYGYVAFVLILVTARNVVMGEDFFWPRVRRYVDALVGTLSLVLSTQADGEFRIILALYGVSLMLSPLRDILKVSGWPVAARKAFNYIANSYIVLAIFLMAPSIREALHVEPAIVLIILYFITYRLVWRGLK